jgi:K+-transporting ATPase c subunit
LFERINIGKFKNTQVVIPIINNIVKTKQIPVNQFDTEDLLNLSASNLNPDISNNITITQIDAETGETFQNELPIKDAIVDIKKQSKLLENLLNCTKLS